MKKNIFVWSLLLILGLWAGLLPAETDTESQTQKASTKANHPVLLELFTSQGCSSCPPADRVLQKLDKEAQAGELPVIALSYHVDYWNRLGWTDPYSDTAFSKRQRNYASKINDQGVYTPQLVIQGKSGHIGSREGEVRSAIAAASRHGLTVDLTAKLLVNEEGTAVDYEWYGIDKDVVLNVALAEEGLENAVPRGENRGRQLSHTNVVRSLITVEEPNHRGNVAIPVDVLSQIENGKVVLFIQDSTTWEVLGVTTIDL